MIVRHLLSLILLLITVNSFARDKSIVLSDKVIKSIENKLQKVIKENSLGKDKNLYYLYTLGAREFMQYGHYGKAKIYYNMAKQFDQKLDASEIYFNLIFLSYKSKDSRLEVKKSIDQAETYLKNKSNPKYLKTLEVWKKLISKSSKLDEGMLAGFFSQVYSRDRVERFVAQKKYALALSLYPTILDSQNINVVIESDMLRTLIFGKGQKLSCHKTLKKYPHSIAYSMEICRYLLGLEESSISNIEKSLKEDSPRRLFWLSALKGIK